MGHEGIEKGWVKIHIGFLINNFLNFLHYLFSSQDQKLFILCVKCVCNWGDGIFFYFEELQLLEIYVINLISSTYHMTETAKTNL